MESYRIMMWFICVSSCVASAEPFILCYPLAHRKLRSLPVRIACSLFPSGDVDCTASNAFETLIPFRDQNVLFHSILCKVNFCSWLQKMSTFFFPFSVYHSRNKIRFAEYILELISFNSTWIHIQFIKSFICGLLCHVHQFIMYGVCKFLWNTSFSLLKRERRCIIFSSGLFFQINEQWTI